MFGGRVSQKLLCSTLLLAFVLASCSQTSALDPQLGTESSGSSDSKSDSKPTSENGSAASNGNSADPIQTWSRMVDLLEASDLSVNQKELSNLADPSVIEDLRLLAPEGGEIVSQPNLTVDSVGSASVVDCVILPAPAFDGPQSSVVVKASLTLKETGWRVTSLTEVAVAGCITEAMSTGVLAGYWLFWNAVPSYWDPPDPSNPAIAETTTGRQTDLTVDRLEQFKEQGKVFRLGVAAAPEIVGVDSLTQVTILDCQQLTEGHGVFDAASGERLEDVPPISEGEREGIVVTMERVGETWKVAWMETGPRNECTPAPTGRAVAVVAN